MCFHEMSLINELVDGHPVNVVHMFAVHGGAEESTPALWRLLEGGGEEEEGEERERENETWRLSAALL